MLGWVGNAFVCFLRFQVLCGLFRDERFVALQAFRGLVYRQQGFPLAASGG